MVGTAIDCQLQMKEANSMRPKAASLSALSALSAAPREQSKSHSVANGEDVLWFDEALEQKGLTRSRGERGVERALVSPSGPWQSVSFRVFRLFRGLILSVMGKPAKRAGKRFTARLSISKCDSGLGLTVRWGQADVEELFVSGGVFLSVYPDHPAAIVLPF